MLKRFVKPWILLSLGWAVLCLSIIIKVSIRHPELGHGMNMLIAAVALFLAGFIPSAIVYWIGRRIWGVGYIRRAYHYAFEIKDPTTRHLKRPFLVLCVIVVHMAAVMWLTLFLKGIFGLDFPAWIAPALVGASSYARLKTRAGADRDGGPSQTK